MTYEVTVNSRKDLGDSTLANFVVVGGDPAPDSCGDGDPTCTTNAVSKAPPGGKGHHGGHGLLPNTGGPLGRWPLPFAALLVLAGAILIRTSRRDSGGSHTVPRH